MQITNHRIVLSEGTGTGSPTLPTPSTNIAETISTIQTGLDTRRAENIDKRAKRGRGVRLSVNILGKGECNLEILRALQVLDLRIGQKISISKGVNQVTVGEFSGVSLSKTGNVTVNIKTKSNEVVPVNLTPPDEFDDMRIYGQSKSAFSIDRRSREGNSNATLRSITVSKIS